MSITAWPNPLSKLTIRSSSKASLIAIPVGLLLLMSGCAGGGSPAKTVAPVIPLAITSTAPLAANEGDVYTYAIAANDASAAVALLSGPAGAQVKTNILTWTPTSVESRVPNAFEIQAANGASTPVSQKFSITPTGTIRGTAVDTYVTSAGNVTGLEDLTKVYVGASIQSANAWSTIDGIVHADGTFEIPGVPAGNYWFTAPSGGHWTSSSHIDMGQDILGRHDGLSPTSTTYLNLRLLALNSWETPDSMELFNANLGQDFDWSENINPGDTSIAAQWQWTGPLSDASRGDSWYASQVATKEVGDTLWRYLAKATPGISITQADGNTTEFPGAFADAAPLTLHIKMLGSQFIALAPAIGLDAEVHSTTLGVYSQPFTASKGMIGEAHTMLESEVQDPVTQDVDFGELTFGNPFPTNWTPFVSLDYEFSAPFTASGASSATDVPAEIFISTTELPSLDQPLAPVISPVRNVKLNGNAFVNRQNIAMLTPSLSWDSPAIGTATNYRVTIYQLSKTGSSSNYQALLDLFTKDSMITIPDGILVAEKEYFFAIRSYLAPTVDLTVAPYRAGFPWAHTDKLTAVVSTAGAPQGARSALSSLQRNARRTLDPTSPRPGSISRPGLRNARSAKANAVSQ